VNNSGIHGLAGRELERRLRVRNWTDEENALLAQQFDYYGVAFPFSSCSAPFPADILSERGHDIVVYETLPHQRGIGARTDSACEGEISPLATDGFVAFGSDENRTMVVRLSQEQTHLAKQIIEAALKAR
jgi:hypothetical protein